MKHQREAQTDWYPTIGCPLWIPGLVIPSIREICHESEVSNQPTTLVPHLNKWTHFKSIIVPFESLLVAIWILCCAIFEFLISSRALLNNSFPQFCLFRYLMLVRPFVAILKTLACFEHLVSSFSPLWCLFIPSLSIYGEILFLNIPNSQFESHQLHHYNVSVTSSFPLWLRQCSEFTKQGWTLCFTVLIHCFTISAY